MKSVSWSRRCGAPLSCPAGQQSCQTSSTTTACQAVTTGNCGPGCFGEIPLEQWRCLRAT